MKFLRATHALLLLGILSACAESTERNDDANDGKISVSQAARYAENNRKNYPSTVVPIKSQKLQIWNVPYAGYDFAVVQLKFGSLKIEWIPPQDTVPAIEKFTGCHVPSSRINYGRRSIQIGEIGVVQIDC